MNKGEFIKSIATIGKFTNKEATAAYDAFVASAVKGLKEDGKIQLVGFGTFELRKRAARNGINPLTKKKIKIAASKAPALKFGKSFKELFN